MTQSTPWSAADWNMLMSSDATIHFFHDKSHSITARCCADKYTLVCMYVQFLHVPIWTLYFDSSLPASVVRTFHSKRKPAFIQQHPVSFASSFYCGLDSVYWLILPSVSAAFVVSLLPRLPWPEVTSGSFL